MSQQTGFSTGIPGNHYTQSAVVAPGSTPRPPAAPPRRSRLPVWADVPGFTAFAQEVEAALDSTELRYSQRLHLLRRAEHFGIRRFDANLIIAMVQHRMNDGAPDMPPEAPGRFSTFTLVAAGVTQLFIVVAVWWLVA